MPNLAWLDGNRQENVSQHVDVAKKIVLLKPDDQVARIQAVEFSRRGFVLGSSALALAACGGDDSSGPPPTGGGPTPAPPPPPTPVTNDSFDSTATTLDPYLAAITNELVLYNAKARDYRVSLIETDVDLMRVHIWDEQIGREVASFQIANPDYGNLPERVLLTPSNPLNSQQFSGLQGWLRLNSSAIEADARIIQFTGPQTSRIERNNVTTRAEYTRPQSIDDFEEVIPVGPGRNLTTIRAALESLYDGGRLADQSNPDQLPVCLRANPFHRIALVFDPGTYTGVSEHVPDWVYLVGREPDSVVFEHAPGATGPIIEGQANTGAIDLTLRNTAPNGASGTARYAWHTDYVHGLQTPDSEGDINRDYAVDFRRVKFIVGPTAQIQAFGSGIGVQASANFIECEFDCENINYVGPLVAANNSAGTIGGGRFTFANCRDVSGRAASSPTIGVQSKSDATNPNIVEVNDSEGFASIALTPGTLGVFAGKWRLTGNTAMTVFSSIPGDNL